MKLRPPAIAVVILLALGLVSGCVLAPAELKAERLAVSAAGAPYAKPAGSRDLPYVPFTPTWQQVLHRAFLADGGLESSYDQWAAAVARVDEMGAYPNTPVSVGYSYLFSPGHMTAWDRSTLSVGPDPQTDLTFPTKVAQAGKTALAEAKAAGRRFRAAKFDLQRRALTAYWDLVLMDQKIRIQQDNVDLLQALVQTAAARVQTGGPQQDLLKAQIDERLAENELESMDNEHGAMLTTLNAMLGRDPEATILAPVELPAPRPAPADDATLITVAVDDNPELSALAAQVEGREDALELARMAFIPEINPAAAFTGSLSQSIGAVVILPFTTPKLDAQVREAEAMLHESRAVARQAKLDRSASFVAALLGMRDDERAAKLLEESVLPKIREALRLSRDAYAAGAVSFADLVDTQRTLLAVRTMLVEARMGREKKLAELESLAGVDLGAVRPLPFFKLRGRAVQLHNSRLKGATRPAGPSADEVFFQ